MKTIQIFTLLFLLLSAPLFAQLAPNENLSVEGIDVIPSVLAERLAQYQNIRDASFAEWDASGKGLYISTRFADVAQIHHLTKAGAYREQITFFKEPVTKISTNPTNHGFLYSRDSGGNEQFQIYYFDAKTGISTLLTDGKSRNTDFIWNTNGDKIAYGSTKRTGKDVDFYISSLNNPTEPQLILENKGGGWSILDWVGNQMLVFNYISINESKMYILNLESKKLEEINPSDKQISYTNSYSPTAKFSRDAKGVFLTSDENTEFVALRYYDINSHQMRKIVDINHDIDQFDLSADGTKMVFVVNQEGYSKPYLMDTKSFNYAPLNFGESGVILKIAFNKDNNRIAYDLSNPTHASEVYIYDVKTQKTERWTFSETAGLNSENFSTSTQISYPTFDIDDKTGKTRRIPAFLFKPKTAKDKLPLIIFIHGGPESQTVARFSSLIQFWVNELGVAVITPNVRGSAGYGKSYLKLDNGILRENSVKDIGALLDWVATQPNLDASRIAVYGGSYGGYMSLATMTNYNDKLKCGVDLYGISNFVSFLKNTSGYRADLRRMEYGDERDPTMAAHLQKISPLTNIKNITKPMFIYQGENDPRVPLSESIQMVNALKQNEVKVSFIKAKDEGHGIAKKANRDYTLAAIAQFLKKHLLGE